MEQELLHQELLNRATWDALQKMREGEVPKLDPAFEPELCWPPQRSYVEHGQDGSLRLEMYPNGCPILSDD